MNSFKIKDLIISIQPQRTETIHFYEPDPQYGEECPAPTGRCNNNTCSAPSVRCDEDNPKSCSAPSARCDEEGNPPVSCVAPTIKPAEEDQLNYEIQNDCKELSELKSAIASLQHSMHTQDN